MQSFQKFILNWYQNYGRHQLPWRQTSDPYHILVSEIMLQQTQVERVIPKYQSFLTSFPSVIHLAQASLADVLKHWQGLGYNRRAKFLHLTAQAVAALPKQKFPTTLEELQKLPGVGPYTASAIMTFAYNQPVTVIETNIRTVFLYHFFPQQTNVHDRELLQLIKKTIPARDPKVWYSALMDYGSYLKKILPNPSRRSKHYNKQSRFTGSLRQVRGEIIRLLTQYELLTISKLKKSITGNAQYFDTALAQLITEKIVVEKNSTVSLPDST